MSVLSSKYISDFSPQNIPGLVVWLDADDSNTITQSAGVVSLWKDKSPNALDVSQTTIGSRPTYETNVQNGRSAIRFTTSQMMRSTQNFTLDKGQTWFVSFKALASGNIFFFEQGPNTNTNDGQFLYGGNNSLMYMKRGAQTRFIDDPAGRGTSPFAVNTWYIGALTTSNTIGNGDTYWSINGVSRTPSLTGLIAGTATNQLYINNTTRVPASNYYGEIIIYNDALSSNQVQLVERYLARKWGVTLSNTHPFFSVPAAMRPFNPLDISGCALWLDAADYASLTFSSGSNVSQWRDKSGMGTNAVISNTGTPVYVSNSLNGGGVLSFNSSNDGLYVANNFTSAAYPSLCYFIVIQPSATQPPTFGGILSTDTNNIYGRSLGINSGFWQQEYYSNFMNITPYVANAWSVVSLQFNGTTSSTLSVNGTTYAGAASGTGTNTLGLRIGSYLFDANNTTFNANFNTAEILVYGKSLTTNERQQVELYLAEKWGLRSSLSSSNAIRLYRSLSPVFNPSLLSNCTLWLDCADDSTMTFSAGNLSTWRDKSGRGNNGTATGTITRTGTINGTNVLQWTQTTGTHQVVGALSNSTTTASFFAVFNMSSTTSTFARALSVDPNGRDWTAPAGVAAIMKYGPFVSQRSDTLTSSSVISYYNTPVILSTMFDGASNYMHVNGTAGSNGASTGNFNYLRYGVGKDNGNDGPSMIGAYAEVLHFPRFLSTAERQLVEAYLSQKWNIALPSNHPYKTIRV